MAITSSLGNQTHSLTLGLDRGVSGFDNTLDAFLGAMLVADRMCAHITAPDGGWNTLELPLLQYEADPDGKGVRGSWRFTIDGGDVADALRFVPPLHDWRYLTVERDGKEVALFSRQGGDSIHMRQHYVRNDTAFSTLVIVDCEVKP